MLNIPRLSLEAAEAFLVQSMMTDLGLSAQVPCLDRPPAQPRAGQVGKSENEEGLRSATFGWALDERVHRGAG